VEEREDIAGSGGWISDEATRVKATMIIAD
jgi:hypothetical protein